MKRLIILLAAPLFALSLTACAAKTYRITTNAGQTYIANGSPEYDVKAETYTFTDDQGREVVINKNDIDAIKEQ